MRKVINAMFKVEVNGELVGLFNSRQMAQVEAGKHKRKGHSVFVGECRSVRHA